MQYFLCARINYAWYYLSSLLKNCQIISYTFHVPSKIFHHIKNGYYALKKNIFTVFCEQQLFLYFLNIVNLSLYIYFKIYFSIQSFDFGC